MRTLTKELQAGITPARALELLKEGNKRFVQNLKINRNLLEQVNDTREGQWPFAVILSCIDSRTSAELIFDQGLGDIFSVRIAGNIVNEDILGSMEFACAVAGSKFVLVLGHTKCGAIKGACDDVHLGNLTTLLSKIRPSVTEIAGKDNTKTSADTEFVEKVSALNVKKGVEEVLNGSPILREMVEKGQIGIGAALYDVTSGQVDFFDDAILVKQEKDTEVAAGA